MQKQIFADLAACRACLTCEVACRSEHSPMRNPLVATLRGEPTRLFVQAHRCGPVPVTCRHCEEPACRDACPTGAITKEAAGGRVGIDADACVGCAMCVMACPFGAIVLEEREGRSIALKCDLCGERERPACVEACPQYALLYCTTDELDADKRARLVAAALG